MITISNLNKSTPYAKFNFFYEKAKQNKQDAVEAIALSSFNNITNEVESRFVNLKYIIDDEFIFFSNYQSLKSQNFDESCIVYLPDNFSVKNKLKPKQKASDLNIIKKDQNIIKFSDELCEVYYGLKSKF